MRTIIPFALRRATLVPQMAADLISSGALYCQEDAIRLLASKGYRIADIIMMIDDARQAAFQQTIDIVAREIAAP